MMTSLRLLNPGRTDCSELSETMKTFFLVAVAWLSSHQLVLGAETESPLTENHMYLRSQMAADALWEIQALQNPAAKLPQLTAVTAQDALAALDIAGADKALVISNAYVFSMPELNPSGEYLLVRRENDFIANQAAQSPDRLVGLCSVNPMADYALDEIQRCAQQLGLAGVSLHLANSDVSLRSSAQISQLATLFEFLEVLNYPAMIHLRTRDSRYGATEVKLFIDNVLSEAPSIDIQIAHFAGSGGFDDGADRAMGEFIRAFSDGRLEPSHVQFDLAGVVIDPATRRTQAEQSQAIAANDRLSARIRQLDYQQVLFASDWPNGVETIVPARGIAERAATLSRFLSLSETELAQLFLNQSRLLNGFVAEFTIGLDKPL